MVLMVVIFDLNYHIDASTSIGRISNVDAIYSNNEYVFVRQKEGEIYLYSLIDKNNDDQYLNSNEIVEGPFTKKYFDSLRKAHKQDIKINWIEF